MFQMWGADYGGPPARPRRDHALILVFNTFGSGDGSSAHRHAPICVPTPGTLGARDFLVAQSTEKDHGDERSSYRLAVLAAVRHTLA
jgi:hypothetical protein